MIYKCESIVPPTQTGPPITRLFEILRMASMAFMEGMCHQDEPPTVGDPVQNENAGLLIQK